MSKKIKSEALINAENYFNKILDIYGDSHPKTLDAKKYVKEIKAQEND